MTSTLIPSVAIIATAEKVQLSAICAKSPALLRIDGRNYHGALRSQFMARHEYDGGVIQRKTAEAFIDAASIAESALFTSGVIRTQTVTHMETGDVYRVNAGDGVTLSRHGAFYKLKLTQEEV